MNALILVGGRGSRMGSLTDGLPKPLLKVGGRTILELIIDQLQTTAGVSRVILAVGYLANVMQQACECSTLALPVTFLHETQPLGTAGPLGLLLARHPELVTDPLLVMNGDVLTNADLGRFVAEHRQKKREASICAYQYSVECPYGVIQSMDDVLTAIREKPLIPMVVSAGVYVFAPSALAGLHADARLDMPDFLNRLSERGVSIGVYHLGGGWLSIETAADLIKAEPVVAGWRALRGESC